MTEAPAGATTQKVYDNLDLNRATEAFLNGIPIASTYAIAYLDKEGNALDGSKTYKINLPKDVPAKDFWSFTLYVT